MTRSLQRTFFLGQMEQQDKRTSANEEKDRKRDRWNVEHERILLLLFFFLFFYFLSDCKGRDWTMASWPSCFFDGAYGWRSLKASFVAALLQRILEHFRRKENLKTSTWNLSALVTIGARRGFVPVDIHGRDPVLHAYKSRLDDPAIFLHAYNSDDIPGVLNINK